VAIASADGIGFVIDVFAVVGLEIDSIEQSPRCRCRCARVCHRESPQVSALVGPY
jgi:hypothetical protein